MKMITATAVAGFVGIAALATPAAAQSTYGHSGMYGQSYGNNYNDSYGYGHQPGYGLGSLIVPGIRDTRRAPNGYVYNPSTEAAVEFQESFERDQFGDE